MAIQFDAATAGGGVSGTTLTWSHTCSGANQILFAFFRGGDGEGDKITGVTYNSVAMTKLGTTVSIPTPSPEIMSAYYLFNPAQGAHNIVASLSSGFLVGASASYKNVLQTGIPDAVNTLTATSGTSKTISVTTVLNNCWTILWGRETQGLDNVGGAGATFRVYSVGADSAIFDSNGAITPAGSTSMTVTANTSDYWGLLMLSFGPALSGGAAFLENFI